MPRHWPIEATFHDRDEDDYHRHSRAFHAPAISPRPPATRHTHGTSTSLYILREVRSKKASSLIFKTAQYGLAENKSNDRRWHHRFGKYTLNEFTTGKFCQLVFNQGLLIQYIHSGITQPTQR